MRLTLTDDTQLADAAARTMATHHAPRLFIQIGPKIRVGGTLGKIGQSIKEGVGKVAKVASVPVSFVNPGLGALLSAGGKVLDTSDGGTHLNDIPKMALNAGLTSVGGKLAGSVLNHIPGVSGVTDRVKDLLDGLPDGLKNVVSGGGSDGKGSFGTLGDLAGSLTNGGSGAPGQGSSLLDKLLLGGTIAAGAADEIQKRNLQNKATDYATSAYDAKAPLRAKALALLQNPSTPDFSAISSDPGNVYDKARRARMLAAEVSKVNPTGGPIQIGGHVFDPSKRGAAA